MNPGSLSSTGSALKQPCAAFFSIQNLQLLPYVFGDYVHKYWQSQRRFCDRESALHRRGYTLFFCKKERYKGTMHRKASTITVFLHDFNCCCERCDNLSKLQSGDPFLSLFRQVRHMDKSNLCLCSLKVMQQGVQYIIAHICPGGQGA